MSQNHSFSEPPFRKALPALLFLTSIFFMNFMGRILLAPFLPEVEREFSLTHAEAGSFFLAVSVGYSAALLFCGHLAKAVGHKWTIVLSSLVLGAGLVFAARAGSPDMIRLGLLAAGVGGGVYFPSAFATIVSVAASRDIGKALAVHELAPNVSLILAPLLAPFLALLGGAVTWRQALAGGGGLAVTLALAYGAWGGRSVAAGRAKPVSSPSLGAVRDILRRPEFWLFGSLFALNMGASMGHYTMTPLYLVGERGVSVQDASRWLALSRCCALASALVAGLAIDRFGARRMMLVAFVADAILTAAIGLTGAPMYAAILLQPMTTVLFFPAVFAAVHRFFGRLGGMAVSFIVPIGALLGGGGAPTMLGWLGDRGSFASGFALLGALLGCGALLTAWARPSSTPAGVEGARLDRPESGA